jgi:hypothetical protein
MHEDEYLMQQNLLFFDTDRGTGPVDPVRPHESQHNLHQTPAGSWGRV